MGLQFAISFKEHVLGDESVRQRITTHTSAKGMHLSLSLWVQQFSPWHRNSYRQL